MKNIDLVIICLIASFFIGTICGAIWFGGDDEIRDLGQSICKEEYNMDYNSYYEGVLKCDSAKVKVKYGGIKVDIIGGDT